MKVTLKLIFIFIQICFSNSIFIDLFKQTKAFELRVIEKESKPLKKIDVTGNFFVDDVCSTIMTKNQNLVKEFGSINSNILIYNLRFMIKISFESSSNDSLLNGYQIQFYDLNSQKTSCIRLIYSNNDSKVKNKFFELIIKNPSNINVRVTVNYLADCVTLKLKTESLCRQSTSNYPYADIIMKKESVLNDIDQSFQNETKSRVSLNTKLPKLCSKTNNYSNLEFKLKDENNLLKNKKLDVNFVTNVFQFICIYNRSNKIIMNNIVENKVLNDTHEIIKIDNIRKNQLYVIVIKLLFKDNQYCPKTDKCPNLENDRIYCSECKEIIHFFNITENFKENEFKCLNNDDKQLIFINNDFNMKTAYLADKDTIQHPNLFSYYHSHLQSCEKYLDVKLNEVTDDG